MPQKKIIIVGAGAAGLMAAGQAALSAKFNPRLSAFQMAAGQAALSGASVLLLEKMPRSGCKLRITGKGRCNLTNITELSDFLLHFGSNGRFLRQAFALFFSSDLMDFFEDLGLPLIIERGGRVFPADGKAPDVVKALNKWLAATGIVTRHTATVTELVTDAGRITGVRCNGRIVAGDAVILATGGASYPATGSTGDGYRLAASAGHTIVPIRPALVPLVTAPEAAPKMAGLTLRNVGVKMIIDGKKKRQGFGEIAFTEFGLSGPLTLTFSGDAVDAMNAGHRVVFALDLKPALDETKLDARLIRDFTARAKEGFASVLRGLLPRQMTPVCIEATGISADKPAGTITVKERKRLLRWIKDFRLTINGHRPLDEAIVTAGGVDLREVNPRTMESRLIPGLYIAGELLDIHGDTGGYNLQAAFSTGWLAGRSAAVQEAASESV